MIVQTRGRAGCPREAREPLSGGGFSESTPGCGTRKRSAEQDVLVHHPVAKKTVERMIEGGRPVLLEEKMADPREPIADQRDEPEPAQLPGNDRERGDTQHQRAADEMKASAGQVLMFAQIE